MKLTDEDWQAIADHCDTVIWSKVRQVVDARVAELEKRAAGQWQPIETAPRNQVFLGWIKADRCHDVSRSDFCWWRALIGSPDCGYFDNSAGNIGDAQEVTHWMPLPAAPDGGTTEGGEG